ncbi:MAG: type IX secretion system sortase PorU, partial [Bacteroidota bacterium]|nr:type IX secretion system sortase PorU [Bacteroidota bacterium]
NNPDLTPHYLLLFGDGHYDFRGISGYQNPLTNHIFPFETAESVATIASYTSDDYFGLLDPNEGEWVFTDIFDESEERVDIGIGRLPVQSAAEAEVIVDKLIRHDDPASFGAWRARYTVVADDGPTGLSGQQDDKDLHLSNIDQVAELITDEVFPAVNMKKIYGETYERVFLNGFRIPEARRDILDTIERGTLVFNYSGHGGPDGLAQEAIFTREDASLLTNGDRLPVVITATCSFGWWDLEEEQSGAEVMLLNPNGGAIALFTSVRLAFTAPGFSSLNAGLNRSLNQQMFIRDDGAPRRLGDIMRTTKNTEVGLEGNSRKFNLLGDPSMRLGLPAGDVMLESLNGAPLSAQSAQMRALDKVTIAGVVRDGNGLVDTSFDGLINVSVFDAERQIQIKDRRWNPKPYFRQREDLLWRGDVRAEAGQFQAEFVVPKDISYTNLHGRIAAYAMNEGDQAIGYSENFIVGGTSDNPPNDNEGPRIDLFLNDSTFVAGSTVDADPELIVRLFDASGINTVGTGVGHEILLSIDGDEANATDIGSAFVSAPDSYQDGEIRWPLSDLDAGPHSLSVRAWDVLNNSNTAEISFSVANDEVLDVFNVYNYPNPMNRETRFIFEHNQPPGTPAEVQIRIYTLSGRPIRTIHSDEALPEGVLGSGPLVVHWDGKDDDLDRPATGIYLYRIRVDVDHPGGDRQVSEHVEKLAIIR